MARKKPPAGITNEVLLQHMQGMRQALETRMINGFAEVHGRLGRVEKDIHNINDALQRLYAHRVNMLGRIERLEETVGIA